MDQAKYLCVTGKNGYDIWNVNSAVGRLINQASTLASRHLRNGFWGLDFAREVGYYGKHIANQVTLEQLTPEQALINLLVEQRDLLNQSDALRRRGHEAITWPIERLPAFRLTRMVMRRDKQRLLRYVHAQNLDMQARAQQTAISRAASTQRDTFRFPPEAWPARRLAR